MRPSKNLGQLYALTTRIQLRMWMGAAQVLQWTQDWARARELSFRVATLFVEELEQLKEVVPGVAAWLGALKSARVPCAIVSSLPTTLLKARLASKCASSFGMWHTQFHETTMFDCAFVWRMVILSGQLDLAVLCAFAWCG